MMHDGVLNLGSVGVPESVDSKKLEWHDGSGTMEVALVDQGVLQYLDPMPW